MCPRERAEISHKDDQDNESIENEEHWTDSYPKEEEAAAKEKSPGRVHTWLRVRFAKILEEDTGAGYSSVEIETHIMRSRKKTECNKRPARPQHTSHVSPIFLCIQSTFIESTMNCAPTIARAITIPPLLRCQCSSIPVDTPRPSQERTKSIPSCPFILLLRVTTAWAMGTEATSPSAPQKKIESFFGVTIENER